MIRLIAAFLGAGVAWSLAAQTGTQVQDGRRAAGGVISLDGEWLLAVDPDDAGQNEGWFSAPVAAAKLTKVPWIIQEAFPGYHGVAWYWRDFEAPAHPDAEGRYLLRFWAVDYAADVWLNGKHLGRHEGGETPFVLDATSALLPSAANRLGVRVLNPTDKPIDGIVLAETPHRNKVVAYGAGSSYNHGGIVDSVELVLAPALRVSDVFAYGNPGTGKVQVRAEITNALDVPVRGSLECSIAAAAGGETLACQYEEQVFPPGVTDLETELTLQQSRLWALNDPFLYRLTCRLAPGPNTGNRGRDEYSVRFGFRDFRFEDGYFRLNGKRVFLRCSHTGNHCPIGLQLPYDPDLLRRDLLNVKVMGFNAIRFIAGVATRYQLDLCDEIGLLVYEEAYASWCLADSPAMAERFDASTLGMIRRDRNHASLVIWGLLNETPDGPVFRHAAALLPRLRKLDPTRLVLLNSGRWDLYAGANLAGLESWSLGGDPDPNVCRNPTERPIRAYSVYWAPGRLSAHPGPKGEYSVVRWTSPQGGTCRVDAVFTGIAEGGATTDVHVLHDGESLFDGSLNLRGEGNKAPYSGGIAVEAGDTLDFVVGYGNGNYGGDSTGLDVRIELGADATWDAAHDFSAAANPNGAWTYGVLRPPGEHPDSGSFSPFSVSKVDEGVERFGSLSNPGSEEWEDVLHDQHCYPRVPHSEAIIRSLRTYNGGDHSAGMGEEGYPADDTLDRDPTPVFLSEYGIGSAVDLVRVARQYEQRGAEGLEDAQFYRSQLDRFMEDWRRWRLEDTFGRPEDYFAACLEKMASQRLLGIDVVRANPHFVGYSLTGTVDQGMTGEGLFTTFRELKPGTVDDLFQGLAPLRWCLFAEPWTLYCGQAVHLRAVLANEDALPPGEYPAVFCVTGPAGRDVLRHETVVAVPAPSAGGAEPPFAQCVFEKELAVDGPPGAYRFTATFLRGAAATGGEVWFHQMDPAAMPPVNQDIVQLGEDEELEGWLESHGVHVVPFEEPTATCQVIVVSQQAPFAEDDAPRFAELARRIAGGSTAIFLTPSALQRGDAPAGWLPLEQKGTFKKIVGWLYLKDEWAKNHSFFEGLPSGGLMDYSFYGGLIPDVVWSDADPTTEAVAGAVKTSQAYDSGLTLAMHAFGAGRLIVNTFRIRPYLGKHPAAERLLRNVLCYASRDAGQPLVDPPADFAAQLQKIGYR